MFQTWAVEAPAIIKKSKTILKDTGGNLKLMHILLTADDEGIDQLEKKLQKELDNTPEERRLKQILDKYVSAEEQEKMKNEKSSSTLARRNAVHGKENVLVGAADFDSLSESSQRDPTRKDKVANAVEKYG